MLHSLFVKCQIILHICPNQLKNNPSQKNNENEKTICFVLQKMSLYISSIKRKENVKFGRNFCFDVKRNAKERIGFIKNLFFNESNLKESDVLEQIA